ncbi:hypothetical protein [Thalassospira xiamenensis]|uniref:hypothetical protein n=1 Tax=Thalassospira xiamenensis TaxID=220697 RepID=UPI0011BFAE9A|nr:hypothetical protein [Thalassospira xiamenensis]MCK2167774.1 hypothetical protein [Thalassospira xiamenensis]
MSADENVLAQTRTYHPLNFGARDGDTSLPPVRLQTGVAEQQDLPHDPLIIDTGAMPDIESAADDAWELEKAIVADLWHFEASMTRVFQPYVDEWNRDGALGAAGSFVDGVGNGISAWWDGEKDFWGSAWGWLRSTTSQAALTAWDSLSNPVDTTQSIGRAVWDGAQEAYGHLETLVEVLRALLTGDIDAFFSKAQLLEALKNAQGAIGEFGQLMHDAFENGVEWLNSLIEMIRRTPVLGLIANTAMRVITMMTPNFWAEMIGTGGGFVIPEIIMWLIGLLIGGLAAASGAGAAPAVAALGARAASVAAKIRKLLKGSGRTFSAVNRFLDLLRPIIDQIGPLGRKLRDSIAEVQRGVIDKTQQLFRRTRYWREKLDDLARQGHGPQRHEGDVTEEMLWNRAYHNIDPMTGTTVDYDRFLKKYGVVYDSDLHGREPDVVNINVPGKGNLAINWNKVRHVSGDHATKFNTPADYVRAYEEVLKSAEYKAFLTGADQDQLVLRSLKLSDVFGSNFQARVKGYSVAGGQKNPVTHTGTTFAETVFGNDTKVVAIFEKDANGIPQLKTMYPDP